jgi:hypothetical protein
MIFNQHSGFSTKHAFLSPSNYHWLNYTEDKLALRYDAFRAARRGTDLHTLAHNAIRLGIKLSQGNRALSSYVTDGINYRMNCEQILYYTENCFGQADTIAFRRHKLRIHDLKTGIITTSIKQLEVYAAIFCLEYNVDPYEIEIELRIYQRDEIRAYEPPSEAIANIMDIIVDFDKQIERMKEDDQW